MSKSAYFFITVDYFFCHVFLILEHAHLIFKMSCNQLPRAFCQYCTEATDVCTITCKCCISLLILDYLGV